jgi:hypothetical protein
MAAFRHYRQGVDDGTRGTEKRRGKCRKYSEFLLSLPVRSPSPGSVSPFLLFNQDFQAAPQSKKSGRGIQLAPLRVL